MLNSTMYKACLRKGLRPAHVAEVGVYLPETSNVLGFIQDGVRADLFEADPQYVAVIRKFCEHMPHVSIYPYAIMDHPGPVVFYRRGASTFAEEVGESPATVNDGYTPMDADKFHVEGRLFSEFDAGSIEVLSIDVEGGEFFVLKHMHSRPVVVSVETHGRRYHNPHLAEIMAWARDNGYAIWYGDKSDTVFYKRDAFMLTAVERIRSAWHAYRMNKLLKQQKAKIPLRPLQKPA